MALLLKKNCPDIRNSQSLKLAHLIKKKYKKVFILDEVANKENIKEKNLIFLKKINKNSFDAIILAVPHKKIISKGIKKIKSYLKNNHVFFDLKNTFKKNYSDFQL